MQTLDKKSEQRVARPLKTLVPLIKADLDKIHEIEIDSMRQVSELLQPLRIAIGEKLLEARPQLKHGKFEPWVKKNFPVLGYRAAREYMNMAHEQNVTGVTFSGPQHFRRTKWKSYRENHTGTAKWRAEVQARLDAFEAQKFNLETEETNREQERKLVNDLALEIVSIGYKVLATKMHPDKGGSHEAMQRLNAARDMLKGALR
jgi:hypothetical protein